MPVLKSCGLLTKSLFALLYLELLASKIGYAQSPPPDPVASQIANEYGGTTVFLAVKGTTSTGVEDVWRFGTGFIVSTEGYVMTVSHLFQDSDRKPFSQVKVLGSLGANFDVTLPVGDIRPLQLIRQNTDVDAALLMLPRYSGKYPTVHFCRGAGIHQGIKLHALGFPLNMPLSINSGTLSSKDAPRGLWKTDILLSEGSSGGPVFDETGHVVGGARFDLQPTEESMGNYSVVLLLESMTNYGPNPTRYGIALFLSASNQTDTFVRVGRVSVSPRGIDWFKSVGRQNITLI